MPKKSVRTQKQLLAENKDLRARLDEAEETLRAIRSGEVDALVVPGVGGDQLFTIKGADRSYRVLIEEMSEGALTLTAEGVILYANRRFAEMLKTPLEKVIGSTIHTWIAPADQKFLQSLLRKGIDEKRREELALTASDGTQVPVYLSVSNLLINEMPDSFCLVATDLTEHKRNEAIVDSEKLARELLAASNQSRLALLSVVEDQKLSEEALRSSEEKYRRLVDEVNDGFYAADEAGVFTFANPALARMLGVESPQAVVGRKFSDFSVPELHVELGESYRKTIKTWSPPEIINSQIVRADGTRAFIEVKPAMIVKGTQMVGTRGVVRDITERKQAEARIQRQLEHLTALSAIDRVIVGNFDLKLSLSEILTHVTKELGVDAADILILNPGLRMLEFGAEHGFRTKAIRKAHIRLGESYAGRAAQERRLVQIPNLKDEPDNSLLITLLKGEDFVCYYGVPLISKGQVKGVLDVFRRSAHEPDAEWFGFLNTLAGQAAIAIENSTLFEHLQRSNSELFLAYDATIEGWSHALDLRDKETEGHTQRVTEMTVKLAHTFGISETDMVQVRWGALLHDIGKMGVPDGILLKPGPLTDEEWVAMKKHPTFAYEMLSPIGYLRLALDIPYCHHEKWDGTGYPRGLKGAQIPLAARIFAVVDVWDALKSDRPYRLGWTEEKVREHIRTSSGTHFDPQVVDAFMQLHN